MDNIKQNLIIEILQNTKRDGISNLIEWLCEKGFFTEIASSRGHSSYIGGLADHSYNVYKLLLSMNDEYKLGCPKESIAIAALLHDVCKIGGYVRTQADDGWTYNREAEKGHAKLSICRIKKFIKLTELEELMIKFHMGVYGLDEFEPGKGEYKLRNGGMANTWYHNPIVKIMYFCDELATIKEGLLKQ